MSRIKLSRDERVIIALKKFGWDSDFKKKYDVIEFKINKEGLFDDLLNEYDIPKYKTTKSNE